MAKSANTKKSGTTQPKQGAAVNVHNVMDGRVLLAGLDNDTIKACFFDPQYPSTKKATGGFESMDKAVITKFIKEIDRVLLPGGYLFLWMDKEYVLTGANQWLLGTSLQAVDLIVWDNGKAEKGSHTTKKSDYLLICQKPPVKGTWKGEIGDVWIEKITKRIHPYQKPSGLLKALVLAVSAEDDYILDPCAGSYVVLDVCKATKRDFIGCDLATFHAKAQK